MCTVTYIPLSDHSFILTSNRDEAPKRSAVGLIHQEQNGKTLLFPRDPQANGTWIALSDKHQLVCLLNGAFVKHKHQPPYKMSRGIMVLDFFNYPSALHFVNDFDFEGIEPFTMIIFDKENLYELRWDEHKIHFQKLNPKEEYIWSSCTLYPPEWREKRISWFQEWQKNNSILDQKTILDFHKNAGEGNERFDVVMNYQNLVRTVSITSVAMNKQTSTIRYEDIINNQVEESQLLQ